jgi:TfuA protein
VRTIEKIEKPVVYLGPSLDINIAKTILDADYRPPAQKWDIMNDYLSGGREFILIDGVFLDEYPTPPKEIRAILSEGAKVWGASSMGALRAVELRNIGMQGLGLIYQYYLTGQVEDDDEVAVIFNKKNNKSYSYPLINLRYSLKHLKATKKLAIEVADEILEKEKERYFPFRNFNSIYETCKEISGNKGDEIYNLIKDNWIDLKAIDAKSTLRKVSYTYQRRG